MPSVVAVFWRGVTTADFFNIERGRGAAPSSGGGQSYLSISFAGVTHEELGRFLDVDPPRRVALDRPTVTLESVAVVDDPAVTAPLEFAPRYQPPNTDGRYRISRQNRQYQDRHPAWTSDRGFPHAPNDVFRSDPRMPDLTYLKVYVLKLDDGAYRAGFVNGPTPPVGFPSDPRLDVLFESFNKTASAGVIEFAAGDIPLETWLSPPRPEDAGAAPEVAAAVELTRVVAGKRPRGQGFRVDADVRRAVELRAMDLAGEALEADGWVVEDVSATRSYDFHCERGANSLRVEVKGTTSDGVSVLLTPGEVKHARDNHPSVALIVVSHITVSRDDTGTPIAAAGDLEVVNPWAIDEQGDLFPTGYEYRRA